MWADRRGSRTLAVLGMLVTALGLALMTTLQRDTGYVWPGIYMFIVGIGVGHVQLAQHRGHDGHASRPHRRGIAAGARVLVQNTGAVISIAFVLAIVTSAVPKNVLFSVFSGLANHISTAQLDPVHLQHAHRAVVPVRGLDHRRRHLRRTARRTRPRTVGPAENGSAASRQVVHVMSADRRDRQLRIGEVAELHRHHRRGRSATTRRSACSDSAPERAQGQHRVYTQADVDRVREIIRLRDLLGLSLEQLSQLLEAESARAHLRASWHRPRTPPSASGSWRSC